jgi:hypothetical protein
MRKTRGCVCVYYCTRGGGGGGSGGHLLRETTSRGQCELVCPSRTGTREESGTLYTGWRPVYPGSSCLGIEPKTPGWVVQDPTTRPSGDLIPTIRGSGDP